MGDPDPSGPPVAPVEIERAHLPEPLDLIARHLFTQRMGAFLALASVAWGVLGRVDYELREHTLDRTGDIGLAWISFLTPYEPAREGAASVGVEVLIVWPLLLAFAWAAVGLVRRSFYPSHSEHPLRALALTLALSVVITAQLRFRGTPWFGGLNHLLVTSNRPAIDIAALVSLSVLLIVSVYALLRLAYAPLLLLDPNTNIATIRDAVATSWRATRVIRLALLLVGALFVHDALILLVDRMTRSDIVLELATWLVRTAVMSAALLYLGACYARATMEHHLLRTRPSRACHLCDYPINANTYERCPECGVPVLPRTRPRVPPRPPGPSGSE